ncbi:hypothetical protein D3C86_1073500 [compost metagenome]
MRASVSRRTLAIALALTVLTGCQAPGFMGLSDNATAPEVESNRVVRARFRVLVPASLSENLTLAPVSQPPATYSESQYDDRSVVGARVFLDSQPNVTDTTDDLGYASLAVPQGQLVPVRAEFKTPNGTVSMTAIIRVDGTEQAAPIFPITVASTLVTSKIAQRFSFKDLRHLNYQQILEGTKTVNQAIRTSTGAYDPRYLPNLARTWSVLDTAQTLARLDPILNRALAKVLATPIPAEPVASTSVAASASVVAPPAALPLSGKLASPTPTASAAAAADQAVDTAERATADARLFPTEPGRRWAYDLFDGEGQRLGLLTREVAKVIPKANGLLVQGVESGEWAGNELRFLMKRTASGVQFAAAYRPSVTYPVPMADGQSWQAAPDIQAVAHAPVATEAATESWDTSWRIDFKRQRDGKTTEWSEWLAPGEGFTRFQWLDPRTGERWDARLQPPTDSEH